MVNSGANSVPRNHQHIGIGEGTLEDIIPKRNQISRDYEKEIYTCSFIAAG
jgi:hypothetical protein